MKYVKELRLMPADTFHPDMKDRKELRDQKLADKLRSRAFKVEIASDLTGIEVLSFKYGVLGERFLNRHHSQLGPYLHSLHPAEQKIVKSAVVYLLGASLSDKNVLKFIGDIGWADKITAEEVDGTSCSVAYAATIQVLLTITVEKPLTQEDMIETLDKAPTDYAIRYVELVEEEGGSCDVEEADWKAYEEKVLKAMAESN